MTQHGVEKIHSVSTTISTGIYSPWVRSGMLLVDGIHVSTYSSVESHQVFYSERNAKKSPLQLAHSFFLFVDRLLCWFNAWPMDENTSLLLRAAHALTDLTLSQ